MSARTRPRDRRSGPSHCDGQGTNPPGEQEDAAHLPPGTDLPEGPCFLLLRRQDTVSFSKTNTFALKGAIVALCGDVTTAKPIRSGALLVETTDMRQTRLLLSAATLMGLPVEAQLADRLPECGHGQRQQRPTAGAVQRRAH